MRLKNKNRVTPRLKPKLKLSRIRMSKMSKLFKPFMVMLLVFLNVLGTVPLHAFANEASIEPIQEPQPFYARIDGEEILVPSSGIARVDIEGFSQPVEIEVPRQTHENLKHTQQNLSHEISIIMTLSSLAV